MGPKLLSIEANIGGGKTTLLKHLKRALIPIGSEPCYDIIYIDEPVSEWEQIQDTDGINIIEKFYSNQEKYAFPFQMMAYISRLISIKKAVEENKHKDCFIICERSLWTDRFVFAKMLYDSGKIEEINFQIYLKWFDEFVKDYPLTAIIYINTPPDLCYKRIKERNRVGENIPLDYLNNCHDYHINWLKNTDFMKDKKILEIDSKFEVNIIFNIYAFLDIFFSK